MMLTVGELLDALRLADRKMEIVVEGCDCVGFAEGLAEADYAYEDLSLESKTARVLVFLRGDKHLTEREFTNIEYLALAKKLNDGEDG